jgi:hypothetical protein
VILADGELERAPGAFLGHHAEAAERLARVQCMHRLEHQVDRLGLARPGGCGGGAERDEDSDRTAHHAAFALAM